MARNYWQDVTAQQIGRRRALALTGGTVLGAALLAACGGGGSSGSTGAGGKSSLIAEATDTSKQAKSGGTNKYYIASEPASFDLHTAIAPLEAPQGHVYSRLLQLKAGYLKPLDYALAPDLATSWEWSPDALQLTFKLRQGVKWHNKAPVNGRPFDVQDVLFSWERFTRVASNRGQVANVADPAAPVLGVTATDDKTVVFKLKSPLVYLTNILGNYLSGNVTMIPKETDSTFQIKGDMIGTGPFTLANYTPSVGFTFKRNPDYYEKGSPYLDATEMPVILEYAQALAQLKAGNLYTYPVRGEDIIATKSDAPDINLYRSASASIAGGSDFAFQTSKTVFGWLPAGKSPFNDERVRQALSIAYDRDLFLDTFYNVSKFRSQGLPVDTRWNSAMSAQFESWWLDPQGKDFGANAKFYKHDIAEAKRLLAAAGYPSGLEFVSHMTPNGYGVDHVRVVDILDGMAQEAGFKVTTRMLHDYVSDFQPKYRDSKGDFEGISYKAGAGGVQEPIATMAAEYYSKTGVQWFGFDVNGKGDHSGDPTLDGLFEKAFGEIDNERRKAIGNDIQRYLAKTQYGVKWLGGATGFSLAWPALANFNVFEGDQRQGDFNWWIDDTKAPFKKA